MGKYRILYNYDTGDSFHNDEGLEDYIELEFDNIDVAEANMKRIQEHYKLYEEVENRWNRKKTNQELISECQFKDWFVKKTIPVIYYRGNTYIKNGESLEGAKYNTISDYQIEDHKKLDRIVGEVFDEYYACHCIILMSDDGKPFQMHCPWCGYFERLNFVEIKERERKISFR
jgi:hypothetical protein